MLNLLFKIGGYSAEITLNRQTHTRQNQYVKITSGLILEKCQRQIFVATMTYEFAQKNNSDSFLHWQATKVHRRMRQGDKTTPFGRPQPLLKNDTIECYSLYLVTHALNDFNAISQF